jgi:hypothetical protein
MQNVPTSKTDPSILLHMVMRLVRNGMNKGVPGNVIGLMGVGRGHLILWAGCDNALNLYGTQKESNNEPGESRVGKPQSKLW